MRRTVAAITLMMLGAGLALAGDGRETTYGKGVTLQEAVPISQLLAEPDKYVGRNVRVDGVITAVCKKRGCWMQLTNPDTGDGIRIKVEDGVIVFPYTAMGKHASAEGVFEAVPLTPEQVAARRAQLESQGHDHAQGEACDKGAPARAGCNAPVHDDRIYLIRGTGAIIDS